PRRPMVTVIRPSGARCVKETIPRHGRAVLPFKEGKVAGRFDLSLWLPLHYSRRQLLRTPPWQPRASARTLVRGRAGMAVFSVASERALGPLGKRLRRYVPRRIVRRRHLCASVKCRMDARHQGECPLEQVPYSFRIDWPRSLSLRACSQPIAETAPIGAYRRLARARSPF